MADLNFLLPVVVRNHPHHDAAIAWYRQRQAGEIGVCRVVQPGVIRLLGNSHIMRDHALSARAPNLTSELLTDERLRHLQ